MAISLQSIQRTRGTSPPRLVIFGPPKVGKSTFAAMAPNPIFIRTEDGLGGIDANAFPVAKSYLDVIEALDFLITQPDHGFRTVVIDSGDWLERLIHEYICSGTEKNMADASGGFGKAYLVAVNHWRNVLARLDSLCHNRGMIVIIICHASIVKHNDPVTEPYDIFDLKLHTPSKGTGAGNIVKEWADIIGFARTPIVVNNRGDDKKKIMRATSIKSVGGGAVSNELHLSSSASFVAGNRYGLPEVIDLLWPSFESAMTATMQPVAQFITQPQQPQPTQ